MRCSTPLIRVWVLDSILSLVILCQTHGEGNELQIHEFREKRKGSPWRCRWDSEQRHQYSCCILSLVYGGNKKLFSTPETAIKLSLAIVKELPDIDRWIGCWPHYEIGIITHAKQLQFEGWLQVFSCECALVLLGLRHFELQQLSQSVLVSPTASSMSALIIPPLPPPGRGPSTASPSYIAVLV